MQCGEEQPQNALTRATRIKDHFQDAFDMALMELSVCMRRTQDSYQVRLGIIPKQEANSLFINGVQLQIVAQIG